VVREGRRRGGFENSSRRLTELRRDLRGLLPLLAPLLSGHSQVAIGSRLVCGSRVARGAKREFISRAYNLILRTVLRGKFSDAQCGFKAVRADVFRTGTRTRPVPVRSA
jgi:hypothetical protein